MYVAEPRGSTRTLHVQDNVQILREAMPRHRDNSEKLNIEENTFLIGRKQGEGVSMKYGLFEISQTFFVH